MSKLASALAQVQGNPQMPALQQAPSTAPIGGGGNAQNIAAGLPHPIRGAVSIPMPWWQILLIVAITLAVVAIGVALWLWWREHQRNRPKAPRDPWVVLQERLALAQPPVPFSKTAGEEYFADLSLILREAIERRTQIPATDRTCQELRAPLRSKLPLEPAAVEAVLNFLERADFIKFAKAPTDTAEALSAHSQVDSWLKALIPPDITPADAGAKESEGQVHAIR